VVLAGDRMEAPTSDSMQGPHNSDPNAYTADEPRKMHDGWAGWVLRVIVLFLSSLFLWVIYSNPPLQLRDGTIKATSPLPQSTGPLLSPDDQRNWQFLLDEHKKVTDEIKLHKEDENQLFRYKFALVGGLLAFFLAHIAFSPDGQRQKRQRSPEKRIEMLAISSATCLVLAFAFVVAVTIDIHVRATTIVTNQLGLWIKNFVEPAIPGRSILWYEAYIRKDGMHADFLYGFFYWPPLHFLTWIMYMLYLTVFQNVCLHRSRQLASIVAGFVLVHASVVAFAWMGHSAPSAFQFQIIPETQCFKGITAYGMRPPVLYLIPCILLIILNLCYWRRCWRVAHPALLTFQRNLEAGPTPRPYIREKSTGGRPSRLLLPEVGAFVRPAKSPPSPHGSIFMAFMG
jgi:hypothetical protein